MGEVRWNGEAIVTVSLPPSGMITPSRGIHPTGHNPPKNLLCRVASRQHHIGTDTLPTVQGRNNHAIVARTPTPSDGIALVGWSSSGAAGVKAVQDTYFNSPALTVWRDLSQGSSGLGNSAGLLVATSNGSVTTEKAVEVQANGTSNFHITWNGFATSRERPVCRFLGRRASAPTGTYGTDFSAGDLYFNTADNKFYCHDGASWKAM